MDIFVSIAGLLVLSPILIIISIMIFLMNGHPIIFVHKRPGLNGKIFAFYKFRTMTNEKDLIGEYLSDEMRITNFGNWLRKTSIDELPNLWNVFVGNMSLVGPRPLLAEYLDLYTDDQARRHDVKPGITGWAQVHGRNTITWEEKFGMDLWYVENISLLLDMKIILLTIRTVLLREGISSNSHATMEKYMGPSK
jgi:sugar transferase EpsL